MILKNYQTLTQNLKIYKKPIIKISRWYSNKKQPCEVDQKSKKYIIQINIWYFLKIMKLLKI